MATTVIHGTPLTLRLHDNGDAQYIVDLSNAPANWNHIQFSPVGSDTWAFTIDGTTPVNPLATEGNSQGNAFYIEATRELKIKPSEFSSLRGVGSVSGAEIILEVTRMGPTQITQ